MNTWHAGGHLCARFCPLHGQKPKPNQTCHSGNTGEKGRVTTASTLLLYLCRSHKAKTGDFPRDTHHIILSLDTCLTFFIARPGSRVQLQLASTDRTFCFHNQPHNPVSKTLQDISAKASMLNIGQPVLRLVAFVISKH